MRTLNCPECGEVFSRKDVRRNIKKYGCMECQNCFRELNVDDFPDFNPLFIEEAERDE